jgi:hypothetical protein
MLKYIVAIIFFMVLMGFMVLVLHLSGYKRRKTACGCGSHLDPHDPENSESSPSLTCSSCGSPQDRHCR